MLPLKRLPFICALLALLLSITATPGRSHAQGEPTAIIDAVFNDLSQRLGRSLTRKNVDTWDWTEDVYPDTSLGCPQPGQTYVKGSTRGYRITITYRGVVYDYRVVKDTGAFFRCSPLDSSAAPTTQATPIPAIGTSVPNVQPTANPTNTPIGVPTVLPITAAPPSQNLLAYIAPDGNVHILNMATNVDSVITQDAELKTTVTDLQREVRGGEDEEVRHYGYIRWSPDGKELAFIEFKTGSLYLVSPGQTPTLLASDLKLHANGIAPAAWSVLGDEIAYIGESDEGKQIKVIHLADKTTRIITSFQSSCSGDGYDTDPALDVALLNRNSPTSTSELILVWTEQGFVHSEGCGRRLILMDINGQIIWQTDDDHDFSTNDGALSPDRKYLAGMMTASPNNGYTPAIINLATGKQTPLSLPQSKNVRHIAWASDSQSLLYSVSTSATSEKAVADNALGKQLFNAWPIEVENNALSLWRIPLNGGSPKQLFSNTGFDIVNIVSAPDNSGVAVTLITSAVPMVKLINANKSLAEVNAAAPRAELYFVQYDPPSFRRIALGGQPAFSRTISPTASSQSQTVNCPGAPPSRLVVGGQGRVLPGDPNDIRPAPGAASIGKIPMGATFSVLEGPICTTNGIAWWRVSYNGQTGWTAEGQRNTYFVEPQ